MLNLTKDKRKSLGSFYTPDSLADKMVSKFESLDGNFVDFIKNTVGIRTARKECDLLEALEAYLK